MTPITSLREEAEEPTGWKLVPLEATPEMCAAAAATPGMKAIDGASQVHQARGYPLSAEAFKDGSAIEQAWRAMLAIAPASAARSDEAGPLLTFSLAYMDGVMEGEPPEVRKHWARVRAHITPSHPEYRSSGERGEAKLDADAFFAASAEDASAMVNAAFGVAGASVQLPEPLEGDGEFSQYRAGWNSCLDEIKRLNALSVNCPACNGYGRVNDGDGARSPYGPKCPKCGGSGRVTAGVKGVAK